MKFTTPQRAPEDQWQRYPPANGTLSVGIMFEAGDVEGNYSFPWRYVYTAFQPPPGMPNTVDVSNVTYAYIAPPDFSLCIAPISGTVALGESTTATVTVTSINGYAETVVLSASGQPANVSINFNPESGTPDFTSTMNINVGEDAEPEGYTITITGTGADETTYTTTYMLTVSAEAERLVGGTFGYVNRLYLLLILTGKFLVERPLLPIALGILILGVSLVLYKRKR